MIGATIIGKDDADDVDTTLMSDERDTEDGEPIALQESAENIE